MPKQQKERVEVGCDTNGRPIYKWATGYSRQEVLRNAAQLMIEYQIQESKIKPQELTPVFNTYAINWLTLYKKDNVRHSTASEYNSILNKHLIPVFGEMSLSSIVPDTIQAFMNDRKMYSQKSLHEMKMVLGMILEGAVEDGYITRNPAKSKRLIIPSKQKTPRKVLTEEQANSIIRQIPLLQEKRDQRYIALLIYTGMRREEVLGLRWEDIDMARLRIHVHNAITFKGNIPVEGPPKTEKGNRIIPLNPALLIWLSHTEENKIFVLQDTISQQTIKRMWQRIKKQINVYDATPHCFRHTFATVCHRKGMDDKTLQAIGGWADYATMRDIYTHTQEKDLEQAATMMNTMFSPPCDTKCDKQSNAEIVVK